MKEIVRMANSEKRKEHQTTTQLKKKKTCNRLIYTCNPVKPIMALHFKKNLPNKTSYLAENEAYEIFP